MIVEMESRCERSLDELDAHYKVLEEVLKTPLFYDDPVVKNVIQIIRNSQTSILRIAGRIAKQTEEKRVDNESEEE